MDISKMMDLGFTVVGGQIDRENVNYGLLTPDGPVLTPEGEALLKSLSKRGKKSVEEAVADIIAAEPDA